MNPPVIDSLFQSLDLESNLLPFLKYSGWVQASDNKSHWIVFHGEQDVNGQPLELVFPRGKKNTEESKAYITKAVELITELKNEPLQLVIQNIVSYDRDFLYIKNTDSNDNNAIELKLAVNQINNLKSTLEYSALSEKDARPYFTSVSATARTAVKNFLFGHTFAGSFGFTIETPRLSDPFKFIQQTLPMEDDYLPPVIIPYERRIMERIARGLKYTKQAEQQKDHTILLEEYPSGFNSNMCSSIVGISKDRTSTVEFRISWSPKVKPGEDVENLQPYKIKENGYQILAYTADLLKERKPEVVTIRGNVRGLTSSDNPHNLGTRRAVVVRTVIPNSKRLTDVIVELERDDYSKANKAHIDWSEIQVSGILSRSGAGWRLLNIQGFSVLS